MSFLKVENLTHIYGSSEKKVKAAINDISFSIDKGEVLGIIGHTGSGKSTLVSHLNGLNKPTSGRILIDGEDIWSKPKEIKKIRSKVGLVFQYPEYQLFEETVFEDIAFGPKNLGKTGDELNEVVKAAASIMSVDEKLFDKSPFDLSGGQKRRVAIAGVLAMQPEIVVFDEPTAGLDPIGRETIFKAITEYKNNYNATIIIVSHSMEDIAAICDKVLVLNKGNVAMFDTARNVFAKANELKALGLGIPMVSSVFAKVREAFPNFSYNPLTVEEGLSALKDYIANGGVLND